MAFWKWHAPCIDNGTGPLVGSEQMQRGLKCTISLPSVRPPPFSPVPSSPRFCWFRPPPRCRSPEANSTQGNCEMNGRFLINRRDAKVMGVAAGLADYSGVDPTMVRLGLVALTLLTGPVMIFFYVVTGLLAPHQ